MKMKYERPVMRVEAFQATEYVAACEVGATGNTGLVGMNAVKLSEAFKWFKVPSGGTSWNNWTEIEKDSSYSNLVFGGLQNPMTGTDGAQQYYWTATSGDKTYYLEYSAGWIEDWSDPVGIINRRENPDYESGDMVFVLYEEDTNNTKLDACVSGWHNWEIYPGSDGDNNGGNWSGAAVYDDSIAMFVYRENQIRTYWS